MEKVQSFQSFNPEPSLEAVLQSFEDYVSEVGQRVVQAMPNDENKIIAETTANALEGQLRKVHLFILENYEILSPLQQVEVQKFLRVQDGLSIAEQGIVTVKAVFEGGGGGKGKKFLIWLIKWFGEIKKIIYEILKLIFGIFNWDIPRWVDKWIDILDQIVNLLITLWADVFGIEMHKFGREAAAMEIDYLDEWAAFERLRQSKQFRPS